jgi:hypothetical protein
VLQAQEQNCIRELRCEIQVSGGSGHSIILKKPEPGIRPPGAGAAKMIPQDNFIVVARVPPGCVASLRALLATMNYPEHTGTADPNNALIPFGKFDTIHFARLVVLVDNTLSDRAQYPRLPLDEPTYLCFMVDCDGDASALLSRMAKECAGLPRIFAACEDFDANGDIEQWLRAHWVRPSASYVNWLGRSVMQVREEAYLHERLRDALASSVERNPQSLLAELRRDVSAAVRLTPTPPTPVTWRVRHLLHLLLPCAAAAAAFILFPVINDRRNCRHHSGLSNRLALARAARAHRC